MTVDYIAGLTQAPCAHDQRGMPIYAAPPSGDPRAAAEICTTTQMPQAGIHSTGWYAADSAQPTRGSDYYGNPLGSPPGGPFPYI